MGLLTQALTLTRFEVRVWMSNYLPHKIMAVLTYACPINKVERWKIGGGVPRITD